MSKTVSNIPAISEQTILDWVGSRNFRLGLSYFESQAILDPRRQGNSLKAWCQGSMPQPYRLCAVFGRRGVVEADCSCPVGDGGRCKHVGALLFAWLHQPEAFREMADLDTTLEQRSKPELIAVIKRMLQVQPDLETLLEATLPGENQEGAPVNPDIYRRQIAAAFQRAGDDWYSMRSIPREVRVILSSGEGFLDRADPGNASIVYRAVALGILEYYEMMQDDDGELCATVDRCVEGLADCLENENMGLDSADRIEILQTLFDVYLFNRDYGGGESEVNAPDVILQYATGEEKAVIAGRIRAAMPQGNEWGDGYRRREYGRFLLDLEQAQSDDDAFLEICRQCGLFPELADCLLTLGRPEEAMAEAEMAENYDLLAVADVFLQHGCSQRIEPLLASRIETDRSHRLLDWLKERHRERGELAEALALSRLKLELSPDLSGYLEVRELSQGLGVWQELRPQLLEQWSDDGAYSLLTEIHLEEGEIDLALKSVRQMDNRPFLAGEQLLRVAQAASSTHPQDALEIYRQQAESLINIRVRDNYRRACELLCKVRDLYLQQSQESAWTDFIAELREQNRRLPALMEELENAGL